MATTTDLPNRHADQVLDVRGETCPIPEIETSKKLRSIAVGEVLEVLTDHQPAVDLSLPSLCKMLGYPYTIVRHDDVYSVKILKAR